MNYSIINALADSFVFAFGIIPNVFNLVYPEALFLASKKSFKMLGKPGKWFVCCICLFIPFSWLFLYTFLVLVRKLVNIGEFFGRLTIDIEINEKDIINGDRF